MLNAADQKTVDDVAKYGWHGVHVPTDNEGPGFSFSVGFWETLSAPELILFGLDRPIMHDVLWGVFRAMKNGRVPAEGAKWPDILDGFDCVFRAVHPSQVREYLGMAIWYKRFRKRSDDLSAIQLFWPDQQGQFPWDAGCNAKVSELQPLLYFPREGSAPT